MEHIQHISKSVVRLIYYCVDRMFSKRGCSSYWTWTILGFFIILFQVGFSLFKLSDD